MPLDILILRDPRESSRKCSLTPLRGMEGVWFVNYHPEREIEVGGRILLHPDGEVLTSADSGKGLFLVDCAWRRVPSLLRTVRGEPVKRSLPPLATAYPRKSFTFDDPIRGLASIEALYAAVAILDGPCPELLRDYLWAAEFLEANPIIAR